MEALGIDELNGTAVALLAAFGIGAANGIYSTAMGTGTVYDKAELFAHDTAILMV